MDDAIVPWHAGIKAFQRLVILVVVEEVAVVVVVPVVPLGTGSSRLLFTPHPVVTVCTIILVFAVCLFEPSAPTKSAPALKQDGSSRHTVSVSKTDGEILEVFQMR